jgi:hypothetical protein
MPFHIKIEREKLILEALPYKFQGIFGKSLGGVPCIIQGKKRVLLTRKWVLKDATLGLLGLLGC